MVGAQDRRFQCLSKGLNFNNYVTGNYLMIIMDCLSFFAKNERKLSYGRRPTGMVEG